MEIVSHLKTCEHGTLPLHPWGDLCARLLPRGGQGELVGDALAYLMGFCADKEQEPSYLMNVLSVSPSPPSGLCFLVAGI